MRLGKSEGEGHRCFGRRHTRWMGVCGDVDIFEGCAQAQKGPQWFRLCCVCVDEWLRVKRL